MRMVSQAGLVFSTTVAPLTITRDECQLVVSDQIVQEQALFGQSDTIPSTGAVHFASTNGRCDSTQIYSHFLMSSYHVNRRHFSLLLKEQVRYTVYMTALGGRRDTRQPALIFETVYIT